MSSRLISALLLSASAGVAAHAADPASSGAAPGLSEVVVTAARREQPLGAVAASASVFTPGAIQILHAERVQDLLRQTPGLAFDPTGASVSIRGVASDAGAATTGVYIDDTPVQTRAIGVLTQNPLPSIFDLDRVEVLRGPQGVLYGAGAEGGAIRFVTPRPDLQAARLVLHGEGSGAAGGPSYELGVAGGAPLAAGRSAWRASAWYRRDAGWVDRVDADTGALLRRGANSQETFTTRAALRWEPGARWSISPSLSFESRRRGDTDEYWEGLSDPGRGVFRNGNPARLSDNDRLLLGAVRIEAPLGSLQLISNTAYLWRRQRTGYDAALYNLSYFQRDLDQPLLGPTGLAVPVRGYRAEGQVRNQQDNLSQEVRVQTLGADRPLEVVAGVYLESRRQRNLEDMVDPQFDRLNQLLFGQDGAELYGYGLLPGARSYAGSVTATDRQAALFGQATLALTPRLKAAAGVRVAWSEFRFDNRQDGPYNAPGPSGASGAQREVPVTPRFALSYQAGSDLLLYASAAKGYRIGGANAALPEAFCADALAELGLSGTPRTYGSDNVWSYELGAKTRAAEDRIEVQASVFRLDWSHIQQSVYLPACGFTFVANLGEAVSQGFDLQTRARLSEGLTLDLAAGYANARYTRTVTAGPGSSQVLAAKGDGLPGAPWTVAATASYRFRLADRPAWASLNDSFASAARAGAAQDPVSQSYDAALAPAPSVNLVQMRLGTALAGWDLNLFADNLLDARPRLTRAHEDQQTLLFVASTARPRTIGVTVDRRW